MQNTFNNHLKFYINDSEYGIRNSVFDRYRVEVGQVDHEYYQKNDLYKELRRVSDLVYNNLGNDFELYFSGGTDCEIVARLFMSIGIKPKLLTIRYADNSNLFEVVQAQQLANDLGLVLETLDFDTREFYYSGEALEYATEIYSSQLFFCILYKIMSTRSRACVTGGNVPLTKKIDDSGTWWYYTHMETEESGFTRFSRKYGIPVVYEFFSYTPEAMLYWLELPEIKRLVTTENYKLKLESSKNSILFNNLKPLDVKLRTKTHGWEKTIPYATEAHKEFMRHIIPRYTDCLDGIKYVDIIQQIKGLQ